VTVVHTDVQTAARPYNSNTIKEANPMKKTVKIEGMMCQMCVKHVKTALSALDPNVEVSLENKCATLDSGVSDAAIAAAVKEAGYEVVA
jgi:copper chaperone CopZ